MLLLESNNNSGVHQTYLKNMLTYVPNFILGASVNHVQTAIESESPWITPELTIFGRTVNAPRLTAFYANQGVSYRYSGALHLPSVWTATLDSLREKVSDYCGVCFNSVLLNFYRNGEDAMGWHSDDESCLGPNPVVASLSLGSPRKFRMQHRKDKSQRMELILDSGSLLVMRPPCQADWKHCVPRVKSAESRINLTFRLIQPD